MTALSSDLPFFEQKPEEAFVHGLDEKVQVLHLHGSLYKIADYLYLKEKMIKGSYYLRCKYKDHFQCYGRAVISTSTEGVIKVKINQGHNHQAVAKINLTRDEVAALRGFPAKEPGPTL